jgi:hypothetical membrane protein
MFNAQRLRTRRAAAAVAMIGVVIYVVVDVVLQFLPPHYSAISQAESDLAVGPFGWIMSINFFGRGVTCAALIVAITRTCRPTRTRTVGVALLGVAGFCSALIAFFPTDIPAHPGVAPSTVHGIVHVAGATSGFVLALAAFWILTLWMPGRSRLADAFLRVATVGLVLLGVSIAAVPTVLGLTERICLVGILGWVFVVARALRRPPS